MQEVLTLLRRVAKAMAAVTSQREAFEAHCKECYGRFSNKSFGACISKEQDHHCKRGEMIVTVRARTALESTARPLVRFLQKVLHSIIPRKYRFLKSMEHIYAAMFRYTQHFFLPHRLSKSSKPPLSPLLEILKLLNFSQKFSRKPVTVSLSYVVSRQLRR